MYFLRAILDFILPPRSTELEVREATRESVGRYVFPQVQVLQNLECTVLLPYRVHQVRALIIEAKFKNNLEAQKLLGSILADFLIESEADLRFETSLLLVPIPLSRERHRERGYNQTERICQAACIENPSLRYRSDILSRLTDTPAQTSLSRYNRLRNMKGVFGADAKKIDSSFTYIVVDDVLTTGATMTAAVSALYEAGAVHVVPLALAH